MKKFFDILVYVVVTLIALGGCGVLAWFWPWKFSVGALSVLLIVAGFYLQKFVSIIMVLENDLGQATQALEEVDTSMQQIIDMKLYFDTPEVQQMVTHVMESVKMAQFSVNRMIKNFTDRSKQKFVMVIEEEPETPPPASGPEQQQQEGTVASVERSNH